MALTDENGSNGLVMPVQPLYNGNNGFGYPYPIYTNSGNGNGGFGGDWGWIVLLLLLAGNGGWSMGGFGGFGGFNNMALGYDFPWLLNGQNGINNNVSDGFRTAQLQDSVTSVRDGINALSTQLCGCCGDMQMSLANGFANTTAAITGAQNALAQQMYSNELASLNRSFAEQTANAQGFNGVNSGISDLRYTVATEACADRATVNSALRDVIAANTASTQRILDQLCADKIDAKNDTIAQLRQELLYARGQASQDVQTARILAGQNSEVDALYDRLNNCPVGTVPVYGRQPIFSCNNNGCGCSGNTGFVA